MDSRLGVQRDGQLLTIDVNLALMMDLRLDNRGEDSEGETHRKSVGRRSSELFSNVYANQSSIPSDTQVSTVVLFPFAPAVGR